MKKQLLLLACFLLLLAPVFALTATSTSCLAPKSLQEVGDCIVRTGLFGYEIATILFFICLLFVMAKMRTPLTVAAPALFSFLAIFIGLGILAQVYSVLFLAFLIILMVIITIGLIRIFSR